MRPNKEPAFLSLECLGWSILFFTSITTFSCYVASVPFIQAEWSLSNTAASLVFSSYLAGYAVSSLVFVPLSDRFRPGIMFLCGVTCMCLPNLLFPLYAGDFWTGSVLRFIAGAGQVVAYTTGMRIVAGRYTVRKGAAISIFIALAYLGSTLSYVIMGVLLDRWQDWRTAYFALAVFSSSSVILTVLLLITGRGRTAVTKTPVTQRKGRLDPSLLKDPSVARLIGAYAVHTADLYLVRMWLPLLLGAALTYHGADRIEAAASASTWSGLMFLLGAGSVLAGGWLSDRWNGRSGAILILGLGAIVTGTIGWLTTGPLSFVLGAGFLIGLLTAADSAIYSTGLIDRAPEGQVGSVQALQSFIGFAAGAVVPVIAGWLIDVTEGQNRWGMAFSFNALLSVLALFLMVSMKRERASDTLSRNTV